MNRNAPSGIGSTASLHPANGSVSLGHMVARLLRKLVSDRQGAITAEYAMLFGLVGVTGAAALLTFGPAIASAYEHTRGTILLPIP